MDVQERWLDLLPPQHSQWFAEITLHRDGARLEHVVAGSPEPFSGASMIKTFIARLAAQAVDQGLVDWLTPLRLEERHLAVGDGVMRYWQLGSVVSLHSACSLMVSVSDNTATNLIVEMLGGTARTNDLLDDLGYQSRLRAWVGGRDRDHRANPSSWTRIADPGLSIVYPREHHDCLMAIEEHHPLAFEMFAQQRDRRSVARAIHPEIRFAYKTGTVDGLRHAGGVLLHDGSRVDVTIFTDSPVRTPLIDDPVFITIGATFADTLDAWGISRDVSGSH